MQITQRGIRTFGHWHGGEVPSWMLPPMLAVAGILVWQLAVSLGLGNGWLPSPMEVWRSATIDIELFANANDSPVLAAGLVANIGHTLSRAFGTLGVATVAGVVIGAAIGMSRAGSRWLYPIVDVLRSVPSAALWPLVAVMMGHNSKAQWTVMLLGATWPVIQATADGLTEENTALQETLAFLKPSRQRRFYLRLRSAVPSIAIGIHIAATIALILAVTVEWRNPDGLGLGAYLGLFEMTDPKSTVMMGVVVIIMALGYLVNTLVRLLSRPSAWESIRKWRQSFKRDRLEGDLRPEGHPLATNSVTEDLELRHHGPGNSVEFRRTRTGPPIREPDRLQASWFAARRGQITQRDITLSLNGRVLVGATSWVDWPSLPRAVQDELEYFPLGKVLRKAANEGSIGRLTYTAYSTEISRDGNVAALFGKKPGTPFVRRRRGINVDNQVVAVLEEHAESGV